MMSANLIMSTTEKGSIEVDWAKQSCRFSAGQTWSLLTTPEARDLAVNVLMALNQESTDGS